MWGGRIWEGNNGNKDHGNVSQNGSSAEAARPKNTVESKLERGGVGEDDSADARLVLPDVKRADNAREELQFERPVVDGAVLRVEVAHTGRSVQHQTQVHRLGALRLCR